MASVCTGRSHRIALPSLTSFTRSLHSLTVTNVKERRDCKSEGEWVGRERELYGEGLKREDPGCNKDYGPSCVSGITIQSLTVYHP